MKLSTLVWFILSAVFSGPLYAQLKDSTLFTFGQDKVMLDEFRYVYEKNNPNAGDLYSKKSLDEYLNLYVNFKLKVKAAESQGLDTSQAFKTELEGYRRQLAQSYLSDHDVSDKLVKEAYERISRELKTSHILINLMPDATPEDTLKAWNKIMAIRDELNKGLNFDEAAIKYSDDPSAKDNHGSLGYITAFSTIYAFENAAYAAAIGKISMPVRTKFGYHLIKVDKDRKARGMIKASHILLRQPKFGDSLRQNEVKNRIFDLYKQLQNGASFEELVAKYSEDKNTTARGGDLDWFGTGKMILEFEDAAFSLKSVGAISEPVLTKYGWHIIKLTDKKPIGTYAEIKNELKRKVEKDTRSEVAKKVFIQSLKNEYQFEPVSGAAEAFLLALPDSVNQGKWNASAFNNDRRPLFKIGDKTIDFAEFAQFTEQNVKKYRTAKKSKMIQELYDIFVESELLKVEEKNLEKKHPEFAKLMKEYHDGMLLFEITNQQVWEKAIKDTLGLQKFYADNHQKYQWAERVDARIIHCSSSANAERVKKEAGKKSNRNKDLKELFNKEGLPLVVTKVEEGQYEKGSNDYIDSINWAVGTSRTLANPDGTAVYVEIKEILKGGPKKLEEARGYIISDYQARLEQNWIAQLRYQYPVTINKINLDRIIKP